MSDRGTAFPGEASPGVSLERRACVRYPHDREAADQTVLARQGVSWWLAKVCDLSADGIGLSVKHRFEPGTILEVGLQDTPRHPSARFFVRVRHAGEQGGGRWFIGCAFLQQPNEDQFKALL